MIPRAKLDEIDEAVIRQLIQDEFRESRTLDFKAQLDLTDDGKKKLAEDVCAYANTVGGDLVFGLTAPEGTAAEIRPVMVDNLDEQLLRLTNFLRDALEPRVSGSLVHHAVPLADGGHIVVLRVAASPNAPHRVKRNNHFYLRHSGGKEAMDIHAIRSAFAFADGLADRVRAFRDARLAALRTARTPIAMLRNPLLAVHVIPVASMTRHGQYAIGELKEAAAALRGARPAGRELRAPMTNLDGVVCASEFHEHRQHYAYAQLFRDGCIELVSAFTIDQGGDDQPIIFPPTYECPLVDRGLPACVAALTKLSIPSPIYLSVSWLGVGGLRVAPRERLRPERMPTLLPHQGEIESELVYVEDFEIAPAKMVAPAIDVLWNAIGIDHSQTDFEEGAL